MAIRTGVPQFLCYVTFCKWNGSYPSSYVMLPFENLFIQGQKNFLQTQILLLLELLLLLLYVPYHVLLRGREAPP